MQFTPEYFNMVKGMGKSLITSVQRLKDKYIKIAIISIIC